MCILSRLVPLWARAECKKALVCLFTTLGNKEFVLSCLVLSLSLPATHDCNKVSPHRWPASLGIMEINVTDILTLGCTKLHTHTHTHTHTQTHTHTHNAHAHTHTQACVRTHKHTHTYTHNTHTHTHTHTYTRARTHTHR